MNKTIKQICFRAKGKEYVVRCEDKVLTNAIDLCEKVIMEKYLGKRFAKDLNYFYENLPKLIKDIPNGKKAKV